MKTSKRREKFMLCTPDNLFGKPKQYEICLGLLLVSLPNVIIGLSSARMFACERHACTFARFEMRLLFLELFYRIFIERIQSLLLLLYLGIDGDFVLQKMRLNKFYRMIKPEVLPYRTWSDRDDKAIVGLSEKYGHGCGFSVLRSIERH
jgi:hypothetical protein